MNYFSKLQKSKKLFLGSILFLMFFCFFVIGSHKAQAWTNYCQCWSNNFFSKKPIGAMVKINTDQECQERCSQLNTTRYKFGSKFWIERVPWMSTADGKIFESVAGLAGNPFVEGITWILAKILAFFGWLLSIAGVIFGWIIEPDNMAVIFSNPSIYRIWGMIRDIMNIAFILVLLFSAFCTIFQINKYNYKNILLTLVIMALLVNFSFPITRVIIDVSNVLMYSILNGLGGEAGGAKAFSLITEGSMLEQLLHPKSPTITSLVASIIFVFILAITLLAVGILFVIRVVALIILLMFSSIGFIGNILPGFESFARKWWDNLFRYAFFGPIMALMLYISVEIMMVFGNSGFNSGKNSIQNLSLQNNISEPGIIATLAFFSVPIVVLWMGMGIAQSMSVAGAGAVMNKTQGFLKKAGKAPFQLSRIGLRKLDRDVLTKKTGISLNYKNWQEAWKQRQAEQDTKVYGPAAGRARDLLNKYVTPISLVKPFKKTEKGWRPNIGRGEKTHYGDFARQANILKKQKEVADFSEESGYLSQELETAVRDRDSEKTAAILRILYNNNDQNEMIKNLTREQKKLYGFDPEKDIDVTPENKQQMIIEALKNSGMKDKNYIGKQLSDLGEIAFSKGNFSDYSMGYFNEDTGNYDIMTDRKKWMGNIAGKASNVKALTKGDLWHWNSFLTENKDSSPGNLHFGGIAQLNAVTQSEIEQTRRARRDFIQNMGSKLDQVRNHAKRLGSDDAYAREYFGDDLEKARVQAKNINAFANEIQKLNTAEQNQGMKIKKVEK